METKEKGGGEIKTGSRLGRQKVCYTRTIRRGCGSSLCVNYPQKAVSEEIGVGGGAFMGGSTYDLSGQRRIGKTDMARLLRRNNSSLPRQH